MKGPLYRLLISSRSIKTWPPHAVFGSDWSISKNILLWNGFAKRTCNINPITNNTYIHRSLLLTIIYDRNVIVVQKKACYLNTCLCLLCNECKNRTILYCNKQLEKSESWNYTPYIYTKLFTKFFFVHAAFVYVVLYQ
jgi:hypothetical protein